MPKRQHIVLTGATGFIGGNLARRLLENGHTVEAIVRPESPRRAQLSRQVEVAAISLHARDPQLSHILSRADAIIHVAGAVRGAHPNDFHGANVDAIHALVEAIASIANPPPLLMLSSLAASQPELSDYAASKRKGETVLMESEGIPWTIFRPPAVYGPGDREMRPLFQMIRRGWAPVIGPKGQKIALLHVDDLADAIGSWLDITEIPHGKTLELHDGHTHGGYTIDEILDCVRPGKKVNQLRLPYLFLHCIARISRSAGQLSGRAPMFTPGKLRELRHPKWEVDNTEITRILGWHPSRPLDSTTAHY